MRADQRIERGIEEQRRRRAALLAAGARRIGWKLAFGAPAAQRNWGIDGALVGGLTTATRLDPGSECSTSSWLRPALEAEVAVAVAAAGEMLVAGEVALAIELADLGPAAPDLEQILEGNIFHRAFLLGDFRPAPAEPPAVTVRHDGEPIAVASDPWDVIGGDPAAWVAYVGEFLAGHGQALRAGDILLTGSVVPPIADPGPGLIEVSAPLFGAVSVGLK